MNVDFSRILPNRGLGGVEAKGDLESVEVAENSVKPLFSDALIVQERENFQIGDINEIDIDEIEKEIVRDDKLGKLFSSKFDFEPPEMPNFV